MTAFSGRRFSVFANQSQSIDKECERVGHTDPDSRSRCYRCGLKVVSLGSFVIPAPDLELACTEKDHRFNGSDSSCACGTTRRQTIREELHAR